MVTQDRREFGYIHWRRATLAVLKPRKSNALLQACDPGLH